MSAIQNEINETEKLLTLATFPTIKNLLLNHLTKLKDVLESEQKLLIKTEDNKDSIDINVTNSSAAPKLINSAISFIPIEDYSWDQGEYNSPIVSIFIDLEGVGKVKDNVTFNFTKSSFDVKITNLNNKNYRLIKDNLDKDIIPEQSKCIIKNNKIILKLQKVKGEYSYESWTSLISKKKKSDRTDTSSNKTKDPMGGIVLIYLI